MSKTRSRKECEQQKMKRIPERCLVMVASQGPFSSTTGSAFDFRKTKEGIL